MHVVRPVLVQHADPASAVRSIAVDNGHYHDHDHAHRMNDVLHSPFDLVAALSRSQWAVSEVDEAWSSCACMDRNDTFLRCVLDDSSGRYDGVSARHRSRLLKLRRVVWICYACGLLGLRHILTWRARVVLSGLREQPLCVVMPLGRHSFLIASLRAVCAG